MTTTPLSELVTPTQIENLKKLGTYLTKGRIRADFDMFTFAKDDRRTESGEILDCGTCGCAVGYGPDAGVSIEGIYSWSTYCSSQFTYGDGCLYDWLFESAWCRVCNDPVDTGRRILWTIENGLPDRETTLGTLFGQIKPCWLYLGNEITRHEYIQSISGDPDFSRILTKTLPPEARYIRHPTLGPVGLMPDDWNCHAESKS